MILHLYAVYCDQFINNSSIYNSDIIACLWVNFSKIKEKYTPGVVVTIISRKIVDVA